MTGRRMWMVVAAGLAAALVAGCASMGGVETPPDEMLAGSWVLNRQESAGQPGDSAGWRGGEDAGRRGRSGGGWGGRGGVPGGGGLPGGGGFGGRGGTGGRGGYPGGGMRGGMRGGGGRAPDFAAMRAAFQSILGRQDHFTLEVHDTWAVLQPADGPVIHLTLDGKWHELALPGGVDAKTRAAWRDHGLVIEHEHEGGMKIRESFNRNPGTDRLVATVTISGVGPGSRTLVDVYDAGDAAQTPAAVH